MGTYLARPVTRQEREEATGPGGLRWAAASMQGWRIGQEDAHLALPAFDEARGLGLFGVFDGHCGPVVARLAAEWLPKKLAAAPSLKSGDYPAALQEAFLALDRQFDSPVGRRAVLEAAAKVRADCASTYRIDGDLEAEGLSLMEILDDLCADNPDGMGCTAVVALIEYGEQLGAPTRLHVANCGDSRCVLWDDRGRATAMSKDHKPKSKEERARVEAAGGWVTSEGRIEGNLNLSRALADFAYKRTRKQGLPEKQMISGVPEVRVRTLRPADRFVLLACDGVWETRRGSQATVDALRRQLPGPRGRGGLAAALGRFLRENLAKDGSTGLGMDNMTALLVRLPEAAAAAGSRASAPARAGRPSRGKRCLASVAATGAPAVRRTLRKRPAAAGAAGRGRSHR